MCYGRVRRGGWVGGNWRMMAQKAEQYCTRTSGWYGTSMQIPYVSSPIIPIVQ